MILEFSMSNFRSIKSKCTFSLVAESGLSKDDNFFEVVSVNDNLRLLKSAVIYGANASGKTNLIKGMSSFINMIRRSRAISVDESIPYYEPFAFDLNTQNAPCEMEMIFALKGDDDKYIRYKYAFSFNAEEILFEQLDYYPKGQIHNLFKRIVENETDSGSMSHTGRLSKSLNNKEYEVFKNQLFLPKFGFDTPHEMLTPVYKFFSEIDVWNTLDENSIRRLQDRVARDLLKPENGHLLKRVNKLMRIADTRIEGVSISPSEIKAMSSFKLPDRRIFRSAPSPKIMASHLLFNNKTPSGELSLEFREESAGTRILFALGGLILEKLEKGGAIFFDEMDNSLHPKLCRFLIRLFNSKISNAKNAQLVIATHEVTLLDKDVFRKDQIWFTEKNKYGETEIFSAKDFEGVREDTPFDRWYMNGKFGGDPKIKELEFIFDNG